MRPSAESRWYAAPTSDRRVSSASTYEAQWTQTVAGHGAPGYGPSHVTPAVAKNVRPAWVSQNRRGRTNDPRVGWQIGPPIVVDISGCWPWRPREKLSGPTMLVGGGVTPNRDPFSRPAPRRAVEQSMAFLSRSGP